MSVDNRTISERVFSFAVSPTAVEGAPFFSAQEHFSPEYRENTHSGAAIASIDACFRQYLLERQEEQVRPAWLVGYTLTESLLDSTIIQAIGEEWCDVTLLSIWQLLVRQRNGHEGMLLTTGEPNMFFVSDKKRTFRICARYKSQWNAWALDAHFVGRKSRQNLAVSPSTQSCRIISRCSSELAQQRTR